jgi:hypothetical protein
MKGKYQLKNEGVDVRKISNWFICKENVRMWTEFIWLRMGSNGGALWKLYKILGFTKPDNIMISRATLSLCSGNIFRENNKFI